MSSVESESVSQESTVGLDGPRFRSGLTEVVWMAMPIIIAMASSTLMQFADFWMVARVGVEQAAAVSPAGITLFVIVSFFGGTLSCTNTFVSQSFARKRFADCSRYAWQGIWISLFAGAASLLLWPLAPVIFHAMNHGPEITPIEIVYFRLRLFSIAGMTAITAMTGFFQGVSHPRITMYAALLGNALNVGLNWVLIFGHFGFPAMGAGGAAIATSIAATAQAGLLLWLFMGGHYASSYHSRATWRPDRVRMGKLLGVGWPAGLSWTLDVAIWGTFIAVIVGSLGKVQLAASNMAGQFLSVSFMPTVGLSIATTALVGQNIGRRDFETARARAQTALLLGMGYMAFMGTMFFTFRHDLIRVFLRRPDLAGTVTAHARAMAGTFGLSTSLGMMHIAQAMRASLEYARIVSLGANILICAAVFQAFDAMAIVNTGALKGAGDTRFPAAATVCYGTLLFLPLCYTLTYPLGFGVVGAWAGATLYIFALGVTLLWRWRRGLWEHIDLFADHAASPATVTEHVTPYEPGEEL